MLAFNKMYDVMSGWRRGHVVHVVECTPLLTPSGSERETVELCVEGAEIGAQLVGSKNKYI